MEAQKILTERLLLLQEFGYPSTNERSYSTRKSKDNDPGSALELRVLDVVALLFVTGRGDAYAVTFNDRHLLIAKNGRPTSEDMQYATTPLDSLLRRDAHETIYPIVIQRCAADINKRIQSFHASLQRTMEQAELPSILADYSTKYGIKLSSAIPVALRELLPDNKDCDANFSTVFLRVLEAVKQLSSTYMNLAEGPSAVQHLKRLCTIARTLTKTHFLIFVREDYDLEAHRLRRIVTDFDYDQQIGRAHV